MRLLVLFVGVALLGCAANDDLVVDRAACMKLRDHLIDLRLDSLPDADRAGHRAAFQQALGDDFLSSCERTVTLDGLRCALGARDGEAVGSCEVLK